MIEYKYSGAWPRFCAGFVDGLIFMPVGWISTFIFLHTASIPLRIITCVINSSAFLIYQIWMHGTRGQTLGKMSVKVIVLDVSERPLSLRQAILRDIFGVVLLPIGLIIDITCIVQGTDTFMGIDPKTIQLVIGSSSLIWFLVEVITMFTNNKRRALHDYIAGSVVIRLPDKVLQTQPPELPAATDP